jgi:nucleoside 2-deoxyribosyltransferase
MIIVYLACPYSDPDPQIKKQRHHFANKVAAELLSQGMLVFSPLTYSIPLSEISSRQGWIKWKEFDLAMLSRCDRLLVLKLPGWESSRGVAEEIAHAKELDIPIEWMEAPETVQALEENSIIDVK